MDPAPVSGFGPLDREDPHATAVLADWLSERGDPRGLILALEASGRDPEQLEDLRRRHLHGYSEGLWPMFGIHSEAELRRHVELRWRAGRIVHARPLDPDHLPLDRLRAQLEGLLASDAGVALAELRGDLIDPRALVDALLAGPVRPSILALTVGDYQTPMPRLERVWTRAPSLHELELHGPGIVIDGLARALPRLTQLRLACELDPTPLRAFADTTPFAKLERLAIRLSGAAYFDDPSVDLVAMLGPVLDGSATPALQHLRITGLGSPERLADALEHSPIRERLRSLELSDSRGA